MKARSVRVALGAIFLVGLGLRLLAVAFEPAHHPDEYFQYLEPAWRRLTGAGVETWEWRDGARSWLLPGYHGAWMAALMRLGLRDGRTLITFFHVHWALLSLVLVWAGWRGGALLARWRERNAPPALDEASSPPAGWQGGLLGAFLCATFPLLVRFSVHTLSELASILCLVCALVMVGELAERGEASRRRVLLSGLLLGLGVCLRIQHATVPLFAVLWLMWTERCRAVVLTCALALLPVVFVGVLDRLTWGELFASYIRYVKFNLIDGGAAAFGTFPANWYWEQLLHRLPLGIYALGATCLLGLRANWPLLGSAVGLVLLLSTQAHKEERFIMLVWPLVLIAAAGAVGGWLRRAEPWRAGVRWSIRALAGIAIALVLVDGALHCKGNDFTGLDAGRMAAHAWIARQPDLTGLLYDEPFHVPGYMGLSRSIPQVQARAAFLSNPFFSHILVPRSSSLISEAERAGFSQVFSAGDFVVLHRSAPAQP